MARTEHIQTSSLRNYQPAFAEAYGMPGSLRGGFI